LERNLLGPRFFGGTSFAFPRAQTKTVDARESGAKIM